MERPRMTREQIAKLVVGQEVSIESGIYGGKGKVIKITDDEVEVLVEGTKEDERYLRSISDLSPELQRAAIADLNKDKLFRFDQDGNETDDGCRDRLGHEPGGPDPSCVPWNLEQDETVN